MSPTAKRLVRRFLALSPILVAGAVTFSGLHIGNAIYSFARAVGQNTTAISLDTQVRILAIREARAARTAREVAKP